LFTGPKLDRAWSARQAELERAVDRLSLLGAQEALVLLLASFSAQRVQHLLRCSPSVGHEAQDTFDSIFRSAVCKITKCSLPDSKWIQSELPIRVSGLGKRRVSSLALPAFFGFSGRFPSSPGYHVIQCCSSTRLLSLHTYHVGQLCLEVHHRINLFQVNSLFGTDQEFWPTKPLSNPACQMSTRRPLFSQHQLLTVETGFWHCLLLPVDFV